MALKLLRVDVRARLSERRSQLHRVSIFGIILSDATCKWKEQKMPPLQQAAPGRAASLQLFTEAIGHRRKSHFAHFAAFSFINELVDGRRLDCDRFIYL